MQFSQLIFTIGIYYTYGELDGPAVNARQSAVSQRAIAERTDS
jgi:hypothetical protein